MDVLLTGAAGGLGKAITKVLVERGYRVFAADIQPSLEGHGDRVIPVTMDVTRGQHIEEAKRRILEHTDGLDAIINNAGWFDQFPLAEGSMEQFDHIIGVNVLGAQRVFRTFFPLLYARKGRVINVSSESALALMPLQSYGMSKKMLDAYTTVLRQELDLLGMEVITIRPGAHLTPFIQRSIDVLDRIDEDSLYTTALRNVRKQAGRVLHHVKRDPSEVAIVIAKALSSQRPKQEYWVNVSIGFRILRVLPPGLRAWIFRSLLSKNTE